MGIGFDPISFAYIVNRSSSESLSVSKYCMAVNGDKRTQNYIYV